MHAKQNRRPGPSVGFRGHDAVHRLLASAGMAANKISLYQTAPGELWEAETNRGPRWVSHTKDGWKISKVPPAEGST
jgi:hypothetical protein